ncbi:MAG TPA: hypothetical protein VKQ29_04470 [Aliidongia sp.]|nr:hypothetical protein [Aliidongia sp.]
MDGENFQAARGYRLDSPTDPQGVCCDEDGPALGSFRLLTKTAAGWQPHAAGELNTLLDKIFGEPVDGAALLPGLRAIARALDEGNLVRAMIGTQLLQLPVLSEAQARRAMAMKLMAKASPDDSEHPGWPAGTEDGRGGEFRPKNGELPGNAKNIATNRLRRLVQRRAIRAGLRRLLNFRRLGRISAEIASNAVPGLDVIGDAAMAVDIADMVGEFEALKGDTDAALEFASGGPRALEELRVSPQDESFSSYDAFKKEDLVKRFGPAGDGYEYHHIVEQGQESGIPINDIQSTRNIVRIPRLLHEEISSEYGQLTSASTQTVRESLRNASFDEKWEKGLEVMRRVGILR